MDKSIGNFSKTSISDLNKINAIISMTNAGNFTVNDNLCVAVTESDNVTYESNDEVINLQCTDMNVLCNPPEALSPVDLKLCFSFGLSVLLIACLYALFNNNCYELLPNLQETSEEKDNVYDFSSTKGIKICSHNVNRLEHKLDEIKYNLMFSENPPDIYCCCETFLDRFHWDTNGFPLESRCKTTADSTVKTVESAVVLHRDSSGNPLMYFHTGTCEYVLFKEALVSTAGEMVGACIVIFILALIYEGLKVFREHLLRKALTPNYHSEATISKYTHTSTDTMVIDPQSAKSNGQTVEKLADGIEYRKFTQDKINGQQIISSSHFIQTILHVVQVFISYCLMLAFMTYNVWLCLAVILGAGAGYFMFGWKRAVVVDVNEHCH
ncbi:CTR1 [Mytilus edulis]|uniref:Copper transport protein n=1 Tax=Mytilus edulis TaxID=6550 RepID=A0A8S3RMH1_MYTED|nr:CTR1 [Mytilus edulis]